MLTQTRAALLDSSGYYDRMRDGTDALPMGTEIVERPYTGAHRDISLRNADTVDTARQMYDMRQHPENWPAWMRTVKENAREREATRRDAYDLDCHHCKSAVFVDDTRDACPNCYLPLQ